MIAASSGLPNYLGAHELCLQVFIFGIKGGREDHQINPSQPLMSLQ